MLLLITLEPDLILTVRQEVAIAMVTSYRSNGLIIMIENCNYNYRVMARVIEPL